MQNNEIDILKEILTRLNTKNYSVSFAVSPYLYNYISNSIKDIAIHDNYNNKMGFHLYHYS